MTQRNGKAPTSEDLEKLAQLREFALQEAHSASPYMASLWEAIHMQVARAHLRAQRALARAERSQVLAAAKAARKNGAMKAEKSEEEESHGQ